MRLKKVIVPNDEYDRAWDWYLEPYYWKGSVGLDFQLRLLKMKGKWYKKSRPVAGYTIGFVLNPLEWKFKQIHLYYDGRHCCYYLGPFVFFKEGLKFCKKCDEGGYED